MEENIWKYGQHELDKKALLKYLQSNAESYIEYQGYDDEQRKHFNNDLSYIINGIESGTISGNGLGIFKDNDTQIDEDDVTRYVNTVANAMGEKFSKKKKKEKSEELEEKPTEQEIISQKEKFDIKKHGFQNFFMSKENPFNQQIDWKSWKKQFPNIGMLRGKLIDTLDSYIDKYNNFSELDFKDSPITSEQYLNMLNSLREDLSNGLNINDKLKLQYLGAGDIWNNILNDSSEEYLEQLNKENEENEEKLNQEEKNKLQQTSNFQNEFNNATFENSDSNDWFVTHNMTEKSKDAIQNSINNQKLIIQNHLKNFYKDNYDSENIDKELEDLQDLINKNIYHSKKQSELIAGKGNWFTRLFAIPTDQYKKIYNRLILSGLKDKEAKEMLFNIGAYKEGGIIKASNGFEFPKWFNYKQTALTGWNKDLNKDRWTTQGVGFHTDADSLQSVYDANTNYISDINAINSDIQNYYDNGKYETISDLIKSYNTDATSINDFWKTDHKYGENTGQHAPIFKKLFASRSADSKTGNLNYNLGYQDDLKDVMGSTMWHRRMDWYEKPFEQLTDLEKQNRIHAIKLANGEYGYVYKNHDGTIAEINADEAKRIGDLERSAPQDTTLKDAGVLKTTNDKETKIEKPKKPNQSFFTVDKALAALNYFRAKGHNKEQLDLANRMVPLLYDPMEHHRSVYGNLRAIAEGNRAAGEVRNLTSRPATSDGSLQLAGRLEGENLAQQYIRQGQQSDDETMRQMSELAQQQEKENRENRYNIAMKNRENMHQVSKEKLMALMGKKRADYESDTNFINEWRTWINAKQKADEENANLLFNREMLNYVTNNPQEYIPNWKLYEKLWNRYNNGETLSADEQRTISQIQNHLSNAYYNEIYGKGDYFGYGITRSPWNPILKKGGTITKNQVDTIIKYLKESNNNYNKAIDRSVRGLYNHIKLQRKK